MQNMKNHFYLPGSVSESSWAFVWVVVEQTRSTISTITRVTITNPEHPHPFCVRHSWPTSCLVSAAVDSALVLVCVCIVICSDPGHVLACRVVIRNASKLLILPFLVDLRFVHIRNISAQLANQVFGTNWPASSNISTTQKMGVLPLTQMD